MDLANYYCQKEYYKNHGKQNHILDRNHANILKERDDMTLYRWLRTLHGSNRQPREEWSCRKACLHLHKGQWLKLKTRCWCLPSHALLLPCCFLHHLSAPLTLVCVFRCAGHSSNDLGGLGIETPVMGILQVAAHYHEHHSNLALHSGMNGNAPNPTPEMWPQNLEENRAMDNDEINCPWKRSKGIINNNRFHDITYHAS